MPEPVAPPTTDPLAIRTDRPITPRSREELIAPVMALRDCSYADAEQYILDVGRERAEREVRARWSG